MVKNDEKKLTEEKAVTLIALIVTIIVLTILIAVTITMVKNNGILGNAENARNKYAKATKDEEDILKGYLTIIDGDKVVEGSRTEAWNGATMLTIKISNITGGTFTINVNDVEAHNYGKLYYYVNNTLVYSGTESSYQVTQVDGKQVKDGESYEIKVLAEPFSVKVTAGTGDNIESWLACIGRSNEEGYTVEKIDELFNNKILMNDLLKDEDAIEYLTKSTEILTPKILETDYLEEFVQPTLTSNSTQTALGKIEVVASGQHGNRVPYCAFINASTAGTEGFWGVPSSQGTYYLQITYPYYIYVTGIDFYTGQSSAAYAKADVTAYTDNTKSKLLADIVSTSQGSTKYTMQTLEGWTKTVYFNVNAKCSYYGIKNLQIHGYTIKI